MACRGFSLILCILVLAPRLHIHDSLALYSGSFWFFGFRNILVHALGFFSSLPFRMRLPASTSNLLAYDVGARLFVLPALIFSPH